MPGTAYPALILALYHIFGGLYTVIFLFAATNLAGENKKELCLIV